MLPRIKPMRIRLVKEPFDDPAYIFELKHDDFRAVVYIQNRECKILSRNSKPTSFKSLRENLARLQVQDTTIDGEIAMTLAVSTIFWIASTNLLFTLHSTFFG